MAQPREDREHRNPTQQHATDQNRVTTRQDERSRDLLARQPGRNLGTGRRDLFSPLDPFSMLRAMRQEMDRMFGGFGTLSPSLDRSGPFGETLFSPQIEMFERDGKLIVQADLPGLTKDDVHVDIEENVLRIEGERRHEEKEDREGYFHSERSYGSFLRTIPLPEGVNSENANATFHDGVLEITLDAPKLASGNRRRIDIQSGEGRVTK